MDKRRTYMLRVSQWRGGTRRHARDAPLAAGRARAEGRLPTPTRDSHTHTSAIVAEAAAGDRTAEQGERAKEPPESAQWGVRTRTRAVLIYYVV
eukprot:scaffold24642_cov141-Isochrysis_galbana.AAC.1